MMTYVRSRSNGKRSYILSKKELALKGGYTVVPSGRGFRIVGPRDRFIRRASQDIIFLTEDEAWCTASRRAARTSRERTKG